MVGAGRLADDEGGGDAAGHVAVLGREDAMRDVTVDAGRPARNRSAVDPGDRAGFEGRGYRLLYGDLRELTLTGCLLLVWGLRHCVANGTCRDHENVALYRQ
jgi:hypothetical protein